MGNDVWLIVTDPADLAVLPRVQNLGPVTALVIGDRELADLASRAVAAVQWIETADAVPAEAYVAAAAQSAAAATPRVIACSGAPASRAVLGAVAARCSAPLLPAVAGVTSDGAGVVVERTAIQGAVIATYRLTSPVCVVLVPDETAAGSVPEPATVVAAPSAAVAAMQVVSRVATAKASGLADAARVVSVGRGVRSRADLGMVEELAGALDAAVACSMPVADDLGWFPKDRYVGRSGQCIAPRLYVAVGISGAPQHLEGIRGAKVVVAINSDPDAAIFRAADCGVVGDLYEVVPALTAALAAAHR
ncbi:MAG: electron transfer flavoprotein subunit alpha/FixB family protein [Actinobacteria bacterium]|nr:electron transfer flavoprotein subunit alpha/FixB family protein [Actinomycetota bacterium]